MIFFSLLFSVIYSEDKKAALKGILIALPLIFLPLSLTTLGSIPVSQINILKKIFVFSCFIASVFYFIQTSVRIGLWDGSYKFVTPSLAYKSPYLVYNLTYHHLAPSIHAVFFSLYLALAVILIIFDFKKQSLSSKILYGLLIFYFLVYLILLTSATINFGLYSFLIIICFLKFSFKKISHYLLFFGLVVIGTAITDYLLIVKFIGPDIGDIVYKFDSPSINQKILFSFFGIVTAAVIAILIKLGNSKFLKIGFASLFIIAAVFTFFYLKKNTRNTTSNLKLNNLSARVSYGSEAIVIIKKHPLSGVGIGDKKYKLIERDTALGDKRYVDFGAETLPENTFNPHNQFLDFWIVAGIIPVLCFIFFLINEFSKALRYKHTAYLGLVFCFCLFCFTDVPMMVQRGQIFFIFFICLFENEASRKIKSKENNIPVIQ
jgi:hypothetical protein